MYRSVCAKVFSSYKSTVCDHSSIIDRQAPTSTTGSPQAEVERKDLLPWPIKTRKRGSASNPNRSGKIKTWGFMDLPPKKRILMAVQARRVDRFMCVACGRAFEDYHALAGHRKRTTDGDRRHCKLVRPAAFDGEEETLGLPWYGGN